MQNGKKDVICPKCGAVMEGEFINTVTTRAEFLPFLDTDGKLHRHNGNWKFVPYKCPKCGEIQEDKQYFDCWCGWHGDDDHSGYQGPKDTAGGLAREEEELKAKSEQFKKAAADLKQPTCTVQ